MKKILDKLKHSYKVDKKLMMFLIILALIGIITGTLFTIILNNNDKSLVIEYIENFIKNISSSKISYIESLNNGLILNMIYILSIWLLGLSIIGLPIVIIINFLKAFVLGFSISSFLITYGIKGCLLSFIYVFPHLVINLFLIILLSVYSIRLSIKLINTIAKKKSIDFKNIINIYTSILLIVVIGIILTTLYETFIMPTLIKLIVQFLF